MWGHVIDIGYSFRLGEGSIGVSVRAKGYLKGGYYFLWLYFKHPYIYINFQRVVIKREV